METELDGDADTLGVLDVESLYDRETAALVDDDGDKAGDGDADTESELLPEYDGDAVPDVEADVDSEPDDDDVVDADCDTDPVIVPDTE